MALALAISRSPSEIEPFRFLASPRPYSEDVNLGLIFSAASKSAIAFLVWPLFRLTRPRLSSASTKFGRRLRWRRRWNHRLLLQRRRAARPRARAARNEGKILSQ